jgi:hypothetical protein
MRANIWASVKLRSLKSLLEYPGSFEVIALAHLSVPLVIFEGDVELEM